jgi:hypothetical protein
MNPARPRAMKRFSIPQAFGLAMLAGALVVSVWPCAAAADDAPSSPPAATPPAGSSRPKPPTTKSDAGKPKSKAAATPAAAQPRSITGDLLNDQPPSDLDSQLLDGAPPLKPPATKPPARQPGDKPGDPSGARPADPDSPPTAGPVLGGDPADPLFPIGEQMRAIEQRLEANRRDDNNTPAMQSQIVDGLARLIEQLEQQQNSQQSSSSSKAPSSGSPTERKSVRQPAAADGTAASAAKDRPAKESTERMGHGEARAPTADELRGLMKDVWGQLPAREREQMLQSPPEQFLPKYELLLEKYYKRLSDEQRRRP